MFMSVKLRITEVPEGKKYSVLSPLKLTINVLTQKAHKNNKRG